MDQVFGPNSNMFARGLAITALLVLAVGVAIAFPFFQTSQWATRIGFAPEQPVPFSHAHHVSGLGLDCRYCHTAFDESGSAGMPNTETCMNCHAQLYTTADLLEPVRESWETGDPVEWRRVHDLPDFTYFNHAAHTNARISCTRCHGGVERMPLVQKAAPLSMKWCLDCHRHPETGGLDAPEGPAVVPTLETGKLDTAALDHELLTNCSACHR